MSPTHNPHQKEPCHISCSCPGTITGEDGASPFQDSTHWGVSDNKRDLVSLLMEGGWWPRRRVHLHSCTNKETPVVRELTKRQENCKGKSNAIVIPHLWGCIYKVVGFFLLLINFGVLNSIWTVLTVQFFRKAEKCTEMERCINFWQVSEPLPIPPQQGMQLESPWWPNYGHDKQNLIKSSKQFGKRTKSFYSQLTYPAGNLTWQKL